MALESFGIPPSSNLIGGAWVASSDRLVLHDPSTGEALTTIARGGSEAIDAAIGAAHAAREGEWGRMTALERGRLLTRLGRLVLSRVEDLAFLEARDVGKPLTQARADVVALARYLEFYGGAADKITGETIPYLEGYTVYTLREPHGVTGHIIPWNYPMQIIGRSVGAALAMGNACVLKPAEEACLTALAFAALALEAGMPPGALNVVTGPGAKAGAALALPPPPPPPRGGAGGPSGSSAHLFHRVCGRRDADPDGGGQERRAGDTGTGRQVATACFQ
jgi:aldehyde dehydrogenase (NAD+)